MLRVAALALLLPSLTIAPRAALAQGTGFAPPSAPMLYTRRLDRALPGGEAFVVSRSFSVTFVPEPGGGYRVDGEQVAVKVDAPEALAAFARMEEARREKALFPLHLDQAGLIAGEEDYAPPRQLEQAIAAVLAHVDKGSAGPERAEAAAFVSAVHGRSEALVSHLPHDLFAPQDERTSATRSFMLPGGAQGEVSATYVSVSNPKTGLMQSARREVITRVEGSRRKTVESWTLAPLPTEPI